MEPTKQDSCLSENTFYAVDTIKIFIDEKYIIVSVVKRLKLDEDEIVQEYHYVRHTHLLSISASLVVILTPTRGSCNKAFKRAGQ